MFLLMTPQFDYKTPLEPYLPHSKPSISTSLPFITLTYAQSLDSKISAGKNIRTALSHEETKEMTHYLRLHHAGIMIGCQTAMCDDPGLNCKLDFDKSPRPIIIDPSGKWKFNGKGKMYQFFLKKQGKPPIVVLSSNTFYNDKKFTKQDYVEYCVVEGSPTDNNRLDWNSIFQKLYKDFHLRSIMVEGGGFVINDLLSAHAVNNLINSLIITIAPVYLGNKGVTVSPYNGRIDLKDVKWFTGTRDSVMCSRIG
ncbi:related to 2,5-diamino-6-ribosylamino-4(3H)-pyrimidinone 5'-phosphate reductase [Saccharomycodes ludwigii]|uniref:2,5-diamino-6-ribosylamino-4(3H)-pyrimidinone 5'-phosphate reductase n=1 Tax=Saccharomycodes ludwigii TaxID=36035 RepID=A0A376B3N0_9ASCO|nr:related to 2,5-diamino-6-ribosylamino-4(3H)-pyrimidinone 5'-phosphate reductase [Saccharomycodes ludwigii]